MENGLYVVNNNNFSYRIPTSTKRFNIVKHLYRGDIVEINGVKNNILYAYIRKDDTKQFINFDRNPNMNYLQKLNDETLSELDALEKKLNLLYDLKEFKNLKTKESSKSSKRTSRRGGKNKTKRAKPKVTLDTK